MSQKKAKFTWGGSRAGAGRKPTPESETGKLMKSKAVSLSLATWEKVEARASETGTTRSNVVRMAVDRFFDNTKEN